MNIPSLIWGAIAGLITGLLAYVVLVALALPPHPWALILGVLVFLGYVFAGFPPRR